MQSPLPQPREGSRKIVVAVSDELNAASGLRLMALLPLLATVYLILAGISLYGMQAGAHRADGLLAVLACGACVGTWMLLRRKRVPAPWMHLVAVGLGALALVHGLAFANSANPASPARIVFLVLAAGGMTLYSMPWQGILTALSFGAWYVASGSALSAPVLYYWLLVLVVTALLAAVSVRYRLWRNGRHKSERSTAGSSTDMHFQREFVEKAIEGTLDGLWYWELKSDVFHFSAAWAKLIGYEPEELASSPDEWLSRVHPGYLARLQSELADHLHGKAPQFRNEHRIRQKDGSYLWVLARGTVVRNEAGDPLVLAGSHSDITPLIEAEKRLLTDAFTDELTGLPNRNFLMSHLEIAVEEKRNRGHAAPLFALMFLDLDRFKFINDTMGHHVGDLLLAAVASRLKNCARPDDVVSRFGGDEFVILLRNLHDPEEAIQVGIRMLKALATPFQLGERTIQSGGSIGIALSREDFQTCDEILRFGDIAMYQAKALRNGQVQLFHPRMMAKSNEQGALQSDLEHALKRDQLVLHYQPLIEMASGRIVGAEALLRWQRSPEELRYPAEFLPMAEKTGLIHEIGDWALHRACAQNAAWQRAGIAPIPISVNLSPSQLQQRDLAQRVQRALSDNHLPPQWLELELTEGALTKSLDVAPAALKTLSDLGVRTSIDNFGGGNSSLAYLRLFQFNSLKMDRSFIADITTDARAAAVVRALIALGHSLNLKVVAEGVESDEQFQLLAAERCDRAQGYLTGRPVSSEEMLALLRSGFLPSFQQPQGTVETDLSRLSEAQEPPQTPASGALRWAMERKLRR